MNTTPKANRLHIGIFGRTNVGKSSFLNYIMGQDVSIISHVPGTTTDVVEKAMELLPIGPVLFLDTAGIDDNTEVGRLRVERTEKAMRKTDVAVLIVEPNRWSEYEEQVAAAASSQNIGLLVVVNKIDIEAPTDSFLAELKKRTPHLILCSSLDRDAKDEVIEAFKRAVFSLLPEDYLKPQPLIADLVKPSGMAVLVVPIDLQAPKGRLILPQVQTIRECLDCDAAALVVKEREYYYLLSALGIKPDIVVCDSQAVLKVVADTPKDVPVTTFSILFARNKSDINLAAQAAAHIDTLKKGDKVLIAEACSHHAIQDDIGRVKIPRWLRQYLGFDIHIDVSAGRDYPANLEEYSIVIHCGGCMLNRREMLYRLYSARTRSVPVTNYGIAIAKLQGVLERVLMPFPAALAMYEKEKELIKNDRR